LYTWTVDVDGSDFGGRGNSMTATINGLQTILDIFDQYHIKAIFFFSTEMFSTGFTEGYDYLVDKVKDRGHEIGSHGHFHIRYKSTSRMIEDKVLSQYAMRRVTGNLYPRYRAPWFQLETEDIYSRKKNHVSILKQSWFAGMLPEKPIFYIHPSDIVEWERWVVPPTLFTKILYSRPQHVLDTFKRLCRLYPYSHIQG